MTSRGHRGQPIGNRGGKIKNGGRPKNQSVCELFAKGRCRYGIKCRFSHDQSSLEPAKQSSTSDEEYRSWKRQLRWAPSSNDPDDGKQIWSKAVELLEKGTKEYHQRLLRDLLSEEHSGLAHVKHVLDMRPNGDDNAFIQFVCPFITLVAHPAFLDCLSLDTYVGDLYVFMSGSGGSRAVPFFHSLIQSIIGRGNSTTLSAPSCDVLVPAMLLALREVFRRNQKAIFHDDLPAVMEDLEKISSIGNPLTNHIISSRIAEIQRMVARANGMLVTTTENTQGGDLQPSFKPPSTYPKDIRIPGDRHDNDKRDITHINIIPTKSEILADEPDFLPSLNHNQPHFLDGVERMLDTHFRLLRTDIFGDVKSVLGDLLFSDQRGGTQDQRLEPSTSDASAHFYRGASVARLIFTKKRGFEAIISFSQPRQVHSRTPADRRRWWEDTRRLEEGSLLCFVSLDDENKPLIFLTVSERKTDPKVHQSLVSDPRNAGITVKLAVGEDPDQIELLMKLSMRPMSPKTYLIEFPRVLLGTFLPVLKNLQRMHGDSRLPFANWILPNWNGEARDAEIHVPPPPYARSPTFSFDLKPILADLSNNLAFEPSSDHEEMLDKLQEFTFLDEGQCKALINALSSEFAFIQGPPGTGKSYLGVQLMRVLIANKDKAQLGPIVVVCYTNHALDQFLEHLVEVGIDRIIRIGGRSTSKVLEGKNIRDIAINETKTRNEKQIIGSNFAEIENLEKLVQQTLKAAARSRTIKWANIERSIKKIFPNVHPQFSRVDKEGFKQVSKLDLLERWKTGLGENLGKLNRPLRDIGRILPVADHSIYRLALEDRETLLDHMVEKVRASFLGTISGVVEEEIGRRAQINNVHDEVDRRLLETADVIGVTTMGLAKRISVLQHVNAKVIICEEAGEVLEAHMLSTLIPSVEHLIQIGDPQQLRPQISDFKLSVESQEGRMYQLDRSQFERLTVVKQGDRRFPVAQLNVQRRMRPQIAGLIRNTLYPGLKDHVTVESLPDVVGIRKNVFWYDHTNHEDCGNSAARQRSQSNFWEVEMVHALVRHIVRQGVYSSQDIAVLTPYVGQLQKLRAVMRKDFEIVLSERDDETLAKDGFVEDLALESEPKPPPKRLVEKKKMSDLLRIATVDNFQGEEAKVIVVSLVRSNNENRVGFLKTTNRINVLLSRAQHGMYLFGNSQTYSRIPMWSQVIDILRENNSIGEALALCCPRHLETEILVTKPEDFALLSPEGGCREPCNSRFESCGHRCLAKCHSDSMHRTIKCANPCETIFTPCGHKCLKECGDPCGICNIKIDGISLPCGHHLDQVPCHMSQSLSGKKCTEEIQKRMPDCGHILAVPCYQDVTCDTFKCPVQCSALLECGHPCQGTCGTCNIPASEGHPQAVKHSECPRVCGRRFGTCQHRCESRCHGGKDCGLCLKPCEVKCSHSKCGRRCHEGCTPCIERCTWACEHQGKCSMPCSAPCDRLPCSERCDKSLPCGHRCPSLCGEICPTDYCHICSKKQDQRVDMLELKTYGEIDVDSTPIVVLTCGHFFTAETLDGHVGMSEVYEQNGGNGEYSGFRNVSAISNQSVPRCPDCQCPIKQYATQRYNRVINRQFMGEASKKFLVSGQVNLQNLEKRIDGFETEIERLVEMTQAPDLSQVQILHDIVSKKSRAMERNVLGYIEKVDDKTHPVRKLHDSITNSIRARRLEDQMQRLTTEPVNETPCCDRRLIIGGQMARIRVHQIYLQAILSISRALDPHANKNQLNEITNACNFTAKRASKFFQKCEEVLQICSQEQFPRNGVEARLYYGRVVMFFQLNRFTSILLRATASETDYFERAKQHLEEAEKLCDIPFKNAESLKIAVHETLKLLNRERYEVITENELKAIKDAMVSGSDGMATHSGHWYNCGNGHPFAVGECGMPMEEARCPECGSPVGGQNHAPAQGVTRATQMEG